MGEVPATADIKQDGDKVTGTISSPAGEVPIAGTITGRSLKLDFEAETPQGTLPVTMTGELAPSRRDREGEHRRHGRSGLDRDARGRSVAER